MYLLHYVRINANCSGGGRGAIVYHPREKNGSMQKKPDNKRHEK